jgi:hypothetical protein
MKSKVAGIRQSARSRPSSSYRAHANALVYEYCTVFSSRLCCLRVVCINMNTSIQLTLSHEYGFLLFNMGECAHRVNA